MVNSFGWECLMGKLDIKHVFHLCPVHPHSLCCYLLLHYVVFESILDEFIEIVLCLFCISPMVSIWKLVWVPVIDTESIVEKWKILLYADDTFIYKSHTDIHTIKLDLNNDLANLVSILQGKNWM